MRLQILCVQKTHRQPTRHLLNALSVYDCCSQYKDCEVYLQKQNKHIFLMSCACSDFLPADSIVLLKIQIWLNLPSGEVFPSVFLCSSTVWLLDVWFLHLCLRTQLICYPSLNPAPLSTVFVLHGKIVQISKSSASFWTTIALLVRNT